MNGIVVSLRQGRWSSAGSSCWAEAWQFLGVSSSIHKVQKGHIPHTAPINYPLCACLEKQSLSDDSLFTALRWVLSILVTGFSLVSWISANHGILCREKFKMIYLELSGTFNLILGSFALSFFVFLYLCTQVYIFLAREFRNDCSKKHEETFVIALIRNGSKFLEGDRENNWFLSFFSYCC